MCIYLEIQIQNVLYVNNKNSSAFGSIDLDSK